ncbi:Ubiquitin carboxyl-terminal hydrolase 2 [Diplodia seriata]|uniref:ubiquitinyl hydrolase 1 n=1 Tax=Diplodia seriata TaxID=420778 RepID=A0A1S8BB06_9PEZI|nr:Ubiquitin carboxyl-terminal hydrolase 2 [Diplodia seriata]
MAAVPGGSCRHNLTLKPDQCVIPESWDRRPDGQTILKVASYCRLCRHHISVVLDFRQGTCTWPCPNEDYKLHHFIHVPSDGRRDSLEDDYLKESYRFQCSSQQCGAVLTAEVAPPRLSPEDMTLLTDKKVLEERLKSAKVIDPDRTELQAAKPIDGLYILHAYIRDALNGKSSRIPLRNRKFLVTYGEDCDALFMRLGFTKKPAQGEEETAWFLPSPPQDWNRIQGDALRDRLDDSMQELMCLIDRMPHSAKQELKRYSYQPHAAREAFERIFGSFNFIQTYEQALSCEPKIAEAIKIIADHRDSEGLKVWLQTGEIRMGNDPELEKTKAFSAFGISNHQGAVDDEMLELTLSDLKERDPSKSDEYDRYAAIVRAESGKGPAPAPPPRYPLDQWPVGIENLGNTCYLNAILQFLFTIKPLREYVLSIDEHLMEINEDNIGKKRVGSRMVTAEEVRRSQHFVKELKELFEQLITAPAATIRPKVELVQRALEYAFPNEEPGPTGTDSAATVVSESSNTGKDDGNDVEMADSAANGEALANSQTEAADSDATLVGDRDSETLPDAEGTKVEKDTSIKESSEKPPQPEHPPPIPPRKPSNKPTSIPYTMQQDASEILINILLQLSYAIRPERFREDGEQLDFVKELFYGEEAASLKREGKTTEQKALFNTQYVTVVEGPKNIYEAIDDTLDKGAIEDSDNAEKWTTILRAPPILKIDVKRLGFDKVKKQTIRSEHHLQLEETIYIDRYLRDEATLQRRKQSWEKKAKLKCLRERRAELAATRVDVSLSDAVRAASDFIKDVEADESDQADEQQTNGIFGDDMAAKAEETRKEISSLDDNIATLEAEISSLFADMNSVPYKLHSLFIHRGGTGGGHYLVSIRDFKNGLWRNYNDETITEVTDVEKNIFGQGDTYSKIITTCVVYVKADLKHGDHDLVEAVHREPIKLEDPPSQQQQDVEMTSFGNDDWGEVKFTEGIDPTDGSQKLPDYSQDGYDTSQIDTRPSEGQW